MDKKLPHPHLSNDSGHSLFLPASNSHYYFDQSTKDEVFAGHETSHPFIEGGTWYWYIPFLPPTTHNVIDIKSIWAQVRTFNLDWVSTRWRDVLEFILLVSSCSILPTSCNMTSIADSRCLVSVFSAFLSLVLQPSHQFCDLNHILSIITFFGLY